MIEERGWQALTAQPEPAVVEIIREFYANAKEVEDNVAMVRGKHVPFDRRSIDEYYGLPRCRGEDDSQNIKPNILIGTRSFQPCVDQRLVGQ